MVENIRTAFQGIWSHKLRSFLTMLGVIIGIAAIIGIVSTIQGTQQQIMENLVGSGNNNVTIPLYEGDYEASPDWSMPQTVSTLTDSQKRRIRELEGMVDATFYFQRSYAATIRGNTTIQGGVFGIDDRYLATVGYTVYKGRSFVEEDYRKFKKIALIDENACTQLFGGEDPIGQIIEISGEPFAVAGLIRKDIKTGPVINTVNDYFNYVTDSSGLVLIPSSVWPVMFSFDEYQNCIIRVDSIERMSSLGKAAADILNEAVRASADGSTTFKYKANDLAEKARNQQQANASMNNLMLWIAAIALLVGGIGVMNIMLVSVTERTSEIGLKKALGARKRVILMQFLTESVMLTGMGGVIGVIAGIILSYVISRVSGTPIAISALSIVVSVVFSMAIGIVFGILPSIKAANLNPIEALQRE